jgi:hypothetical protein
MTSTSSVEALRPLLVDLALALALNPVGRPSAVLARAASGMHLMRWYTDPICQQHLNIIIMHPDPYPLYEKALRGVAYDATRH